VLGWKKQEACKPNEGENTRLERRGEERRQKAGLPGKEKKKETKDLFSKIRAISLVLMKES